MDDQVLPESIEGDGLVLRAWQPEDVDVLAATIASNVEHLRPWMPWIADEPLTRDARLALIEGWEAQRRAGGEAVYGVFVAGAGGGGPDASADRPVAGSCGLHQRIGPRGLEIGYWVAHDHLRQGIATRASALLTDAAFALDRIDRVEIHHSVANERSALVPARLGYERLPDAPIERPRGPAEVSPDGIWRITRAAWADRRSR